MNACTKVILVDLETFLVIEQTLLELLQNFVSLTHVEERAGLGSLFAVCNLQDQSFLSNSYCFSSLFLFDEHLGLKQESLNVFRLENQSLV
jgi:hypothetical protein